MECEQIVKARYPQAVCEIRPPVVGASLQHDRDGHWAVLTSVELGCTKLGIGETAVFAWKEAADQVSRETTDH